MQPTKKLTSIKEEIEKKCTTDAKHPLSLSPLGDKKYTSHREKREYKKLINTISVEASLCCG